MGQIESIYNKWFLNTIEDAEIHEQLIAMDSQSRLESFYRELEFGTGGLRGILGAGSNRMNIYTVGKATQGLASYLLCLNIEKKISAAIAYDSRIKSEVFAKEAAGILAANGVEVYIYPQLMPTPSLSFAVRHLHCDAGICITASHNPAEYNGYKVYGKDGCQITLNAANQILAEIKKTDPFEDVKRYSFEEGINQGRIHLIPEIVTDAYLAAVRKESLSEIKTDLHVVYTPLNGAGRMCVTRVLKEAGVQRITMVKEQEMPDGNFTTCPFPNPERKEALLLGLETCLEVGADLLLATDPDCDRVGIAVRSQGEYILMTGNEVGVLLLDYICQKRQQLGIMPGNPVAIKTIVTTDLAEKVAADFQIQLINVLTGFKFIGEQISLLESAGEEARYIFGFEESYGYLSGSYVRDKDGVDACLLICEMAAYYKEQNLSLVGKMNQIYEKYGYYEHELLDFAFEGSKGMELMEKLMSRLRLESPEVFGGCKIVEIQDYTKGLGNLPKADILEYRLDEGSKVIIRPSGTEPKIKVYVSAYDKNKNKAVQKKNSLSAEVMELFPQ